MIAIIGYPRTGTSILYKSLENAGFNGGDNLFGHKYKSQDRYLQHINRSVEVGWLQKKRVTRHDKKRIRTFFSDYCRENGIDVVKDPLWWKTLNFWVTLCPDFKKVKFIRTTRHPLKTAKSYVRLFNKYPDRMSLYSHDGEKLKMTVGRVLHEMVGCEKILNVYLPRLNHINVKLEDVISEPEETYSKISEFVGRNVSPELINENQTYEVNKKVN